MTRDAIMIGGGIAGASVAYHLAREGADVLLVDRDDPGRATDAGAGIISAGTAEGPSAAWFDLIRRSTEYYPDLIDHLESTVDVETSYDRPGLLVIAADESEREAFEAKRDRLSDRQEREGYPPEGALRELDADEATTHFPALGEVHGALYYEDAARVDGKKLTRALLRAGEEHGLDTMVGTAERILGDQSVDGVEIDGERYETDSAVIAGGAWSPEFGAQIGCEIPVEPQRGQIAHARGLDADTGDWPVVTGFRDHYLVPWPGGRVAAGATRESDAGFEPHATVSGVHEVLGEALRVAPGLADAELEDVRVGLRPLSRDGHPVIGEAPLDGAYLATGHGPTGLTFGPYTGRIVSDLVLDGETDMDLSAFSPDRF